MHWLVTSCSTELALSLAQAIASLFNQKLTTTSRNPSLSPDTVSEITPHPNASWKPLDISSPNLEPQLLTTTTEYGAIDCVLTNTPLDLIREQHKTNSFDTIRTTHVIIPNVRSRSQGGVIVNISSCTFWDRPRGLSIYASAKIALEELSGALVYRLAPFGICGLGAQPDAVETAFARLEDLGRLLVRLLDAYKGNLVEVVVRVVESGGGEVIDPSRPLLGIVGEVLEPAIVGDKEGRRF